MQNMSVEINDVRTIHEHKGFIYSSLLSRGCNSKDCVHVPTNDRMIPLCWMDLPDSLILRSYSKQVDKHKEWNKKW